MMVLVWRSRVIWSLLPGVDADPVMTRPVGSVLDETDATVTVGGFNGDVNGSAA